MSSPEPPRDDKDPPSREHLNIRNIELVQTIRIELEDGTVHHFVDLEDEQLDKLIDEYSKQVFAENQFENDRYTDDGGEGDVSDDHWILEKLNESTGITFAGAAITTACFGTLLAVSSYIFHRFLPKELSWMLPVIDGTHILAFIGYAMSHVREMWAPHVNVVFKKAEGYRRLRGSNDQSTEKTEASKGDTYEIEEE